MSPGHEPQAPELTPDARLEFDLDFARQWHRAHGAPSLVLIDWKRAYRDRERYRCSGQEAACRQLWELNHQASYLMTGRQRKFWRKRKT